jgi:hypothetical protein
MGFAASFVGFSCFHVGRFIGGSIPDNLLESRRCSARLRHD